MFLRDARYYCIYYVRAIWLWLEFITVARFYIVLMIVNYRRDIKRMLYAPDTTISIWIKCLNIPIDCPETKREMERSYCQLDVWFLMK